MNAYEKIRAALEQAYKERHEPRRVDLRIDEALAALAELERAAAEPVAWCNPSEFASFVGKPRTGAQTHALDVFSQRGGRDTMPLYAAPPAPVAEIRDVVVTDEMCDRAYIGKWRGVPELIGHEPDDEDRQWSREWLEAWRSELGPALWLVTREEMARSVEIRDTEIARLETDLELARRALKTVRRWCMGNGYSASVQVAMKDWIDGGMKYPLPELPEPERSIDATRAGNGGEG